MLAIEEPEYHHAAVTTQATTLKQRTAALSTPVRSPGTSARSQMTSHERPTTIIESTQTTTWRAGWRAPRGTERRAGRAARLAAGSATFQAPAKPTALRGRRPASHGSHHWLEPAEIARLRNTVAAGRVEPSPGMPAMPTPRALSAMPPSAGWRGCALDRLGSS
ncbi:MAG: hypothetical protein SGPRY_007391 [Prymnesium sp.]